MTRLYLCYDCLAPIWFPYGQKMHIGTGWYCWQEIQERGGDSGIIKLNFNTPKDKLDGFVKGAINVYTRVKSKKDRSPIIKYLEKQIRYNRGDVIRYFLSYLANKKDRELDTELSKFFRSKNWRRFVERQLNKAK